MGIGENMIYNKLQFDNIDSKAYGVYITGSAAFNSPSRDVEMVAVPGRNGELVLDNGRYNNIEVTYPAGTFGSNETDFRTKMRNIRNALASKKGYQRLADSYNPDEYRMATFVDAIEAEPVGHNIAAEFDLVFNCKPQRFLTSGETPISVQDGDTITNPTLYDASPLLVLEGVGTIEVNGYKVKIANETVGDVQVWGGESVPGEHFNLNFGDVYILSGDSITMEHPSYSFVIQNRNAMYTFTSSSITNITGGPDLNPTVNDDGDSAIVTCSINEETFTYGTPSSHTIGFDVNVTNSNGNTGVVKCSVSASYDGQRKIEFDASTIYSGDNAFIYRGTVFTGLVIVHSTAFAYGNPTYIDCDIGEAYAIDNGIVSPLNRYIQLGSKLPVLSPGANAIEYDNTYTDVKIIPRWWLL